MDTMPSTPSMSVPAASPKCGLSTTPPHMVNSPGIPVVPTVPR